MLIADRMAEDCRFLAGVLQHRGYRVVLAADLSTAVELVRAQRPAVVLSNVSLVDGDGYELARRIRADTALASIPVILMSAARLTPPILRMAEEAGAASVIPRYAVPENVVAAVERVLTRDASALPVPVPDGDRAAVTREPARRLRSILSTAGDAFVGVDDRGAITDWNDAAERMFQWPAPEIIGRPLVETIIPPPDRERWGVVMRAILAAGGHDVTGWHVTFTGVRRDGRELALEMSDWAVNTSETPALSGFIRAAA